MSEDDSRRAADKAAEIRRVRSEVLDRLEAGTALGEVLELAASDPLVAWIRVLPAVEALPGIGKVKARRILEDASIADRATLGSLDPAERARLLEALDL